jgi:hypothetical protein
MRSSLSPPRSAKIKPVTTKQTTTAARRYVVSFHVPESVKPTDSPEVLPTSKRDVNVSFKHVRLTRGPADVPARRQLGAEAAIVCEHHRLRPRPHPELVKHIRDVITDRLFADRKSLRDLRGAETLSDQRQHFSFTRGK